MSDKELSSAQLNVLKLIDSEEDFDGTWEDLEIVYELLKMGFAFYTIIPNEDTNLNPIYRVNSTQLGKKYLLGIGTNVI